MSGSLEEIARLAGVAKSTVSRALSGSPGVSEGKRREIVELSRQLGLAPDRNASALRTGRGTDLVIVTAARPPEIVSIRNHCLFALGKAVFGTVRVLVINEGETVDSVVESALSQRCRAIVLSSLSGTLSEATWARARNGGVAIVAVDGRCPGADQVSIEREVGTYQAARMLLLGECRNPVFFSNDTVEEPDARLKGVITAFRSLGRDPSEIQVFPFTGGLRGGFEAGRALLSSRAVDAVFAYNDYCAIGAMKAFAEAGVRVPQDVKVVGFDNLPVTEYLAVPLTTIAQPVEDLAQAAIDMARTRLEMPNHEPRSRSLPARLILRESAPIANHALRDRVFQEPAKEGTT